MNGNKIRKLLVLILIIATIGMVLGGCSRKPSKEDFQNAVDVTWNESIGMDDPDFLKAIEDVSSYKIVSIEEGNFYTINMMVTGIDLGVELEKMDHSVLMDDKGTPNAYLLELIGNCPLVQTEAVVYAVPSDEGYQITFSDTFVDAMSGKIYSYYMEKIEEMMEGTE